MGGRSDLNSAEKALTTSNFCRHGLREGTGAEYCATSAAKGAVDLHGQKRASCGTKIAIVQVITSRTVCDR
jgi:hypothetical protein